MSETTASLRVLLVDDEPLVLESFRMLLEVSGFHVVAVSSGPEALARLQADPFDVLVTDIRMPGMDGDELLAHARQLYPDLPALMVSSHEGFILPGFDGFLPKMEVSIARFRAEIEAAVQSHRA